MKITFGLEAQGHIPTIQAELERWNAIHNEDGDTDMAYSKAVWEAIGEKIGREPFTAALAYFKWLKKNAPEGRWISVDDRLPEGDCDVLVAKSNGLVLKMSFHAPFDTGKRKFQYWGFGKWIDQHSQITHWMPLPPQT